MRKKKGRVSAKNWTVLVSLLIAGGTLIWSVVAHFIPAAESVAKPQPQPANASIINATANGPGGIGYVNGGTVNITVPNQDTSNTLPRQPRP